MASLDDAAAVCAALPDVTERRRRAHHAGERDGLRTWYVGKKRFAWERPFSNADIKRFGTETPPVGAIIAVRVADLVDKEAVLEAHTGPVFTIPPLRRLCGRAAPATQDAEAPAARADRRCVALHRANPGS